MRRSALFIGDWEGEGGWDRTGSRGRLQHVICYRGGGETACLLVACGFLGNVCWSWRLRERGEWRGERLEEKTLFSRHRVREGDEVVPGGLLQIWG